MFYKICHWRKKLETKLTTVKVDDIVVHKLYENYILIQRFCRCLVKFSNLQPCWIVWILWYIK